MCQLNARENRNDFSLDLNGVGESLSVTVLGRDFQVAGAEQRNARFANAVLANDINRHQTRLDYCNAVLHGIPSSNIQRWQP